MPLIVQVVFPISGLSGITHLLPETQHTTHFRIWKFVLAWALYLELYCFTELCLLDRTGDIGQGAFYMVMCSDAFMHELHLVAGIVMLALR